jgi:hypothetical protein
LGSALVEPKPLRLCILECVQVATIADRVQFGVEKPPVAIFDDESDTKL